MLMRSLAVATLALVVSAAADLRLHAQEPPRSAEADIATAPVEIDGTTLFHLREVSSLRRRSAPASAKTVRAGESAG
jgi:hypothetical protein